MSKASDEHFPPGGEPRGGANADAPRARTEDEASRSRAGRYSSRSRNCRKHSKRRRPQKQAVPELYGSGLYELLWRDGAWRVSMRYWRPAPPRRLRAQAKRPQKTARLRAHAGRGARVARRRQPNWFRKRFRTSTSTTSRLMKRWGEIMRSRQCRDRRARRQVCGGGDILAADARARRCRAAGAGRAHRTGRAHRSAAAQRSAASRTRYRLVRKRRTRKSRRRSGHRRRRRPLSRRVIILLPNAKAAGAGDTGRQAPGGGGRKFRCPELVAWRDRAVRSRAADGAIGTCEWRRWCRRCVRR